MLQPQGDHHMVQLSVIPQMEENVPMKTRLPQSEIYQQQQQQQQQQQNPLRVRFEQQQQFYEQIHQKEPQHSEVFLDQSYLQTSIYAVPNRPYSKQPQILCCSECNKAVMTDVELRAGWGSCLCGFLMCLTPLIFLFFLPCCMRGCKDAHHYCRRCGHKIGRYNFICE